MTLHIFYLGTPSDVPLNSEIYHNFDNTTESTTLPKAKALADIPSFEMPEEVIEDEYGYMDRIEGISKGIFYKHN